MPESRGRKKGRARPEPTAASSKLAQPNPGWYAPVMVGLMVLGLIWIVVVYLSQGQYPVASLGNWNLAIGFGLIVVGFLMTTNWR